MQNKEEIICPICKSKEFEAKFEASYVYSYTIDSNTLESGNKEEFLPFLFDNRKQIDSKVYFECTNCHSRFPCSDNVVPKGVSFTILQKAIPSDSAKNPQFLG